MDVQYTIDVENKYLADATMSAKVAAVDITKVEQERADDFAVHTDNTAIVVPGQIQRTITATLTASFESRFPTNNDRRVALNGAFRDLFMKNIPANVAENLSLI